MTKSKLNTRTITVIGMMSALSFIVFMLEIPAPLMPSFIKLDLSNVISLLTAFALGPVEGVIVCFIKNLIHLMVRGYASTMGVGNLFDFVTSSVFCFTAGLIYKHNRTIKGAMIATVVGSLVFTLVSLPLNYFIVYPFYFKLFAKYGGEAGVLGMYQAILPSVKNTLSALLIFNVPFTFVKGVICAMITAVVYKPLSPVIKGTRSLKKKEAAAH
ncbi:Riboflavin transporter FmnP [Ruminococcus sp. YE71]|uniref:ECF transporter S component n=1 Tax=unclassified Ruminococcus TaxID=2608920 RepID=UPI00088A30C6|nr:MULTISPECIES: ECF transporter S component [unclassified Ruminococcus]SDA15953.1 Riboflavin transporter FmnP [Ruminococcus sp. YE78]SFW23560.1 Riboflavin transporter FmnP [Ruminococcus sp. YE71]